MQNSPAFRRRNDHFGRAGGAMEERILARLIEVETVVGMLKRRHRDAAGDQPRNQLGDQGGFAGAAPARETDDTHGPLIAKRPALQPGVADRGFRRPIRPAGFAHPWRYGPSRPAAKGYGVPWPN